jgi:predicted amidophosphoribosyltransferase
VNLDGTARWANVSGSFLPAPGRVYKEKRVLLVDDVMTSGATIQACTATLESEGVDSVLAFTLARA